MSDLADVIFHGYGSVTDKALFHLLNDHYLHRKPPMTDTFEWWINDTVVGVLTVGVPASRHMQKGACPENPNSVQELNRLWVDDSMPHCSASWFISQCLKNMPPRIIISYADTQQGHYGTVYKASNFRYAGWTDMDRKTARFDYIVEDKHSRSAFRIGRGKNSKKIRRLPKVKYWTITGNKKEKKALENICRLPSLSWVDIPPPNVHKYNCFPNPLPQTDK